MPQGVLSFTDYAKASPGNLIGFQRRVTHKGITILDVVAMMPVGLVPGAACGGRNGVPRLTLLSSGAMFESDIALDGVRHVLSRMW